MRREPKVTDEELTKMVTECNSVAEVLRMAGRKGSGGNHSHYSNRIRKLGLDTSHFIKNGSHLSGGPNKKLEPGEVFAKTCEKGSRVTAKHLRGALLEVGTKYVCAVCDSPPTHNGLPLTLQVDHINGNWKDNRQSNLQFICPNCHTQTKTYGNKRLGVAQLG